MREIASTIGRRLGVPVVSTTLDEAASRYGWLAPIVAADNPATSEITRERLGWTPQGPSLLADIDSPAYFPALAPV
jgi:hypothetical protein